MARPSAGELTAAWFFGLNLHNEETIGRLPFSTTSKVPPTATIRQRVWFLIAKEIFTARQNGEALRSLVKAAAGLCLKSRRRGRSRRGSY